jgi:hypothetical protein
MRSRMNDSITAGQVYSWTLKFLLNAKLVKDHGWQCTAQVVLSIVLRAAGRCISIFAACRDLAKGPCAQAVMDALSDGLPKTLPVLERRLNEALTDPLPWRMRRRAWEVAIDWHLQPYYGQPERSRNELYYGEPKQGTTKFHAYASACIVEYGGRYTVALTWVRRHESMVVVLRRLLATTRQRGLKIKRMLMDRAFFNVPVIEFLQAEKLPFVMPVVIRGRAPRTGRKLTGLRWIKHQPAGWYAHTMKNGKRQVSVSICVNYRWYRPCKDRRRHRRQERRQRQKLLFAVWRVYACPTAIREHYRLRFGIETSFRQMRQARIYTCTRSPRLRLFFLALALILRNLWVWLHQTRLADGAGDDLTLHLERLRFRRMLDWIVHEVVALFHDGSTPCVVWSP